MIALLRDPVERAHSNWTHLWSAGLEPIGDFIEACRAEDRRAEAGWATFWRYVSLGRYGEQLQHLYGIFPRDQVLTLRYRRLCQEPARALDRICDFLGVRTGLIDSIPLENVTNHVEDSPTTRTLRWLLRAGARIGTRVPAPVRHATRQPFLTVLNRGGRPRQPLTWEQRKQLIPYFAGDIELLESLTGEDYSDWLKPR